MCETCILNDVINKSFASCSKYIYTLYIPGRQAINCTSINGHYCYYNFNFDVDQFQMLNASSIWITEAKIAGSQTICNGIACCMYDDCVIMCMGK